MHDSISDELERHLSGNASRAFYRHLDGCSECRAEVAAMDDVSLLIRELKSDPETVIEVPPGFYNRVVMRTIERQRREAWGLFSPGPAFFRRIAFASLLLLAGLGSFLVSREWSFSGPLSQQDPATIMAQHDPAADHDASSDRDRMLVTLATYRQ
jgi:anti-sigma factor RsiW